jgi:hypothetical protein
MDLKKYFSHPAQGFSGNTSPFHKVQDKRGKSTEPKYYFTIGIVPQERKWHPDTASREEFTSQLLGNSTTRLRRTVPGRREVPSPA